MVDGIERIYGLYEFAKRYLENCRYLKDIEDLKRCLRDADPIYSFNMLEILEAFAKHKMEFEGKYWPEECDEISRIILDLSTKSDCDSDFIENKVTLIKASVYAKNPNYDVDFIARVEDFIDDIEEASRYFIISGYDTEYVYEAVMSYLYYNTIRVKLGLDDEIKLYLQVCENLEKVISRLRGDIVEFSMLDDIEDYQDLIDIDSTDNLLYLVKKQLLNSRINLLWFYAKSGDLDDEAEELAEEILTKFIPTGYLDYDLVKFIQELSEGRIGYENNQDRMDSFPLV